MKTIVIWDQCGQSPIESFVLEGDYTHLNGVYINIAGDQEKQDELDEILSYDDFGRPKVKMLNGFPSDIYEVGDVVIVCGFVP
jgi:hypothetical protein